jgi:hypothetical protein
MLILSELIQHYKNKIILKKQFHVLKNEKSFQSILLRVTSFFLHFATQISDGHIFYFEIATHQNSKCVYLKKCVCVCVREREREKGNACESE